MMKVNNINNTSFKGYKNIISDVIQGDNRRLIYFSAQLNNANGVKDLDYYRKIIENYPRFQKKSPTDIATCLYIQNGNSDRMSLNLIPLPWGEELLDMEPALPPALYKMEEDIALKSYTLLASLTKRMMHNNLCNKDKNIASVFSNLLDILGHFGNDRQTAYTIAESSLRENKPFDKLALFLNRRIQHSMNTFFK